MSTPIPSSPPNRWTREHYPPDNSPFFRPLRTLPTIPEEDEELTPHETAEAEKWLQTVDKKQEEEVKRAFMEEARKKQFRHLLPQQKEVKK